jgi:serine/threonine-protein kinase RsbW
VTETHQVTAQLGEVGRLNEILSGHWASLDLPGEHEMPVTLALEEILSNVIRHSGAKDIAVRFTFEPASFEFEVTDDGPAFNPLEQAPPLNPKAPLETRRAGGMGVHIVRQLATELRYEHREHRNRLLFRKQWN